MKILIDENMPYAAQLFSQFGEVIATSGRSLSADDLIGIDALMCRSVTKVNAALLAKADKLRFVGSATAGTDHIDLALLANKGIRFTSAPGCNKVGVAEYVLSALMTLAWQQDFDVYQRRVGIVGAGMVGTYLAKCLDALNIPYMLCDPIKASCGDKRAFYSLERLIAECDVISLHTPLTKEGEHATYHLIGEKELAAFRPNSILINAARGAVVDNLALKNALRTTSFTVVLDVFEHEPQVDVELLDLLAFATPHIAGYGLEGKARGTSMVFNAYCEFLGKGAMKVDEQRLLPSAPFSRVELGSPWHNQHLFALSQLIYDIRRDDADFRRAMQNVQAQRANFDQLRKNYWDRREYSAITLVAKAEYGVESLANLGFRVEEIK